MHHYRTQAVLFCIFTAALSGQTVEPETRAGQIEAAQQEKAKHLAPNPPEKGEKFFNQIQGMLDRFMGSKAGFGPVIGNLVTGSGFAAGVEYYRPDLADGKVLFQTSARASIRKYELLDARLVFPRLAHGWAFAEFYGVYRNFPTLTYYGPGPRSDKGGRSVYRLEDTSFDFTGGVKPTHRLRLGVTAGYLRVNTGRGDDDRYASTDQAYTPAQAPGVDFQSDFLRAGVFVTYDYRDRRGDPHSGGNYFASYVFYDDLRLNTADHRKLKAEAQQYIPFFNEKRVIALRAKTELSYRNSNQVVPFYLQPILGGAQDLRGFRPFRFYDNNLLVMTGEYRWEVMSGFDMAAFSDLGKVFHRHAQLNLADLETTVGFGLRFKSRDAVVMRWDLGFSREGFQVWINFNNVF